MQTVARQRSFIDEVTWPEDCDEIPSWRAEGISHGFWGKKQESTPFFYHPRQVHGIRLTAAEEELTRPSGLSLEQRQTADGIYTSTARLPVAVQTADCLPILFYHPDIVMAVHAGWRGLAGGILRTVTEVLAEHGIACQDVKVGMGPAISLASFEVGPELVEAFDKNFTDLGLQNPTWILAKGQGDRWHLDLGLAAVLNCLALGFSAQHLSCLRTCTRQQADMWHSYRRDGQKAGRNWSWVSIDSPSPA